MSSRKFHVNFRLSSRSTRVLIVALIGCTGLFMTLFLWPKSPQHTCSTPVTYLNKSSITLYNNGTGDSYFSIRINDWTISDVNGIASYIQNNMTDEYPGEPVQRKAWRLVRDMRYYSGPPTKNTWFQSPDFLLNSIGYGVCEDSSNALYHIWKALGFNSRIWSLNHNHGVSEVFVNGRWEYYDAGQWSTSIYCYTRSGLVAGVMDIVADSTLITNPTTPILPLNSTGYSTTIANLFDNSGGGVTQVSPGVATLANFDHWFLLPPQVTMTVGNNSVLVSLPVGWSGSISEPLIVNSITGDGNAVIDGQTANGASALVTAVADMSHFVHDFTFTSVVTPIAINYSVNPLIFTPTFNITLCGTLTDVII